MSVSIARRRVRDGVGPRVSAVLLTALVATLVVACGDDDGDSSVDDAPEEAVDVGGVAPSGGEEAWPAPPPDEVASLTEAAGLALDTKEHLVHHLHAHLDVFIDGEHRTVPAGIGIVFDNPGVRTFDDGGELSYGGIRGCEQPCISPLHTHDVTGVIHTESKTAVENTLGQFFEEWDVRLDDECVGSYCTDDTSIRIFVDGDEVELAEAAEIPLSDRAEIAIVIGRPPSRVPDSADFSGA